MTRQFTGWACATVTVALLTAGCTTVSTSPPVAPVVPPAAFSGSGSTPLPEQWWEVFGDPVLNGLEEQALAQNLDLRTTWYRLRQAEALRRQATAGLLPTVGADAAAARSRRRTDDGTFVGNSFTGSVGADYEVDLWGRVDATVRATDADVAASANDRRTAAITLTGEVATAWYDLLEQREQLVLIDEQIGTNTEYLEVMTDRFRHGQGAAADVLQQRQLLEATHGRRILVEAAISPLENRLAVLLGEMPGTYVPPIGELPVAPALPSTGVPADWLARRPDLLSAWADVRAAAARVHVAIADRYPTLDLSLDLSNADTQLEDMLDNFVATMAARLVAPLIDGGRRRAEVDRTRAVLAAALTAYGQALLAAVGQVEDGLDSIGDRQRYLASLDSQLALSAQATEQVRADYIGGRQDFTRYLTTLTSHQSLARSRLEARGNLLQAYISLGRALGGTWEPPPPPSTPEPAANEP